jgi:hypothetical protein
MISYAGFRVLTPGLNIRYSNMLIISTFVQLI